MIISVHIPKTAGTSFYSLLKSQFGPRLMTDYVDWPEGATEDHLRSTREEAVRNASRIRESYDAVHGHFLANKYKGVFPDAKMVTFVRDPYQHALSAYEHATRISESPHPGIKQLKDRNMTLLDFIEALPNHQSMYFRGAALEEFAMVGISESFDQSVRVFSAMFGVPLSPLGDRENVNPDRQGAAYPITEDVRSAVETHRAEDIELYQRSKENFERLLRRYDL